MNDFSKEIRAYGLKNAILYGKADAAKILPKLFSHGLDKKEIGKIMPEIEKIAKEINKLSKEEQEKEFSKLESVVKVREEKEKVLPEIDVSDLKEVITRIPPEPSKYSHLGHALSFLINYMYAKKYNGKCFLRFEDTNPEKVTEEFVNIMKEDIFDYLGIKVDGIRFVSDDMPILYEYAETLVKKGKAYVCFCEREKMQDLRHKGIECECRQFPLNIQTERWNKFLKGDYKEGEATLRMKGDMQSDNHVMRDSVIFRRLDAKHYKYGDKYKIWPMYDFYNPIEDSLMGVTLILRSNEFDLRVELQDKLKDLLKLSKQKIIQYGRFNVIDFTTKGREIRDLIDSGEFIGWDDPRLITLRALKRRGIVKESFYELANTVGLSKHPVNLSFDMIAAINRKIIDSTSNRYSFVEDPVEIKINGGKVKEIEVNIHPDKKETRKIKVGKIFISSKDFEEHRGKEVRLIHLYNLDLDSKTAQGTVKSLENKTISKINWVSGNVKCRIRMPDASWSEGLAEEAIKELKEGDIIQFERFGFCRFDKLDKDVYEFYFAHK